MLGFTLQSIVFLFFDAGLVSWWARESEQKLPPPTLVKSLYMAPQPKRSTPATSAKGWKKSISKIMFCFHRLKSVYLNPWTNSAGACSYVEISNSKVCPLIRFRHYTEFWSLKNGTLINFFFHWFYHGNSWHYCLASVPKTWHMSWFLRMSFAELKSNLKSDVIQLFSLLSLSQSRHADCAEDRSIV